MSGPTKVFQVVLLDATSGIPVIFRTFQGRESAQRWIDTGEAEEYVRLTDPAFAQSVDSDLASGETWEGFFWVAEDEVHA